MLGFQTIPAAGQSFAIGQILIASLSLSKATDDMTSQSLYRAETPVHTLGFFLCPK
jgi:hypothetical protein